MKNILIKPLITEKMTAESERINAYGFVVNDDANKFEIKDAVEKTYGVTVAGVRTMRVDGKVRSRFTRTGVLRGRSESYKKAIVRLVDGDVIDFYENI
ncbi:MAG: 50S ribosomal protein L23 [Flavobacteriales bacterium]